MAEHGEQRRDDEQGADGGDDHHADARVGEGAQEELREDQQGGECGGDGRRREDDGPPGRPYGVPERLGNVGALREVLAEPADHEQGVVDAEAETEGGGEVDREHRHVGDAAEHIELGEGAEDRDQPDDQGQQRRDEAAEGDHEQDEDQGHGDRLGQDEVLGDLGGYFVADRGLSAGLHGQPVPVARVLVDQR